MKVGNLKTLLASLLLAISLACAGRQPTLAEQNLKPRKAIAVTGLIRKVQRDWTYETPCGIIASIMGRCSDVQAFDATLVDSTGNEVKFMFFRHEDSAKLHPMVGDQGTYVLHWNAVFPYLTCAQRSGMTNACMADFTWQLESDMDMQP